MWGPGLPRARLRLRVEEVGDEKPDSNDVHICKYTTDILNQLCMNINDVLMWALSTCKQCLAMHFKVVVHGSGFGV